MAIPGVGRCIAWAVVVGVTVAGCATTKSTGEAVPVQESAAVTQTRSTPATVFTTSATMTADSAPPPSSGSADPVPTTEEYPAPQAEDPRGRSDGGSPSQVESLDLGGPRLGGSFTGPGQWVPDGNQPRSISVAANRDVTTDQGASFNGPGWVGPPEVPDVEVVSVSVTPDQLFAAPANCTRLTTEPSDCMLRITFDFANSETGHSYSADLVFTLRATCPESVGQGCTDEKQQSIPPGKEVTWASSISLTAKGCDLQCLDDQSSSGPEEGGFAEPPDQPSSSADEPSLPADEPSSPGDEPTVAGPKSDSGSG